MIVNNVKRSPIANSLALYDFAETSYDLKRWAEYVVELFRKYGLEPTRMGISAPSIKSTQMKTYIREVKKLDKLDIPTITSITIQATLNGSDNSHGDQIFTGTVSAVRKICVLTLDNAFTPLELDIWNNITKDMAVFFKPRYGYVYQRPYKIGPEWYALGISCDLKSGDPETEVIALWSKAYRSIKPTYKTGDMRDVYPINILSASHNERSVEDVPLFDWINADASHGKLTKLSENLWSWFVDEKQIEVVRNILKPTGILLCAP
jgi:hypothetical protein